jgi:oligopeptidase B
MNSEPARTDSLTTRPPASPPAAPAQPGQPAASPDQGTGPAGDRTATLQPPTARRTPIERTHHGDTIVDDYAWLADKDNPETIAYLEAENAFTEAMTAGQASLREEIFAEIKSRTQETDLSVPVRKGGWWYYTRTVEGKQYAVQCRRAVHADDTGPPRTDDGTPLPGEEILLDCNALAGESPFFSLGTFDVSPDGRLLAYSTDFAGDERFTLRIKDLETGQTAPDEIPDTFYGCAWSKDATALFYVTVDAAWRPYRVWRHMVGAPAADDVIVWEERDERFWVGVGLTRSERYLCISSASKLTSEVRLLDATRPAGEARIVLPRRHGVEYSVEHQVRPDGTNRLLILHNDGALDFELAALSLGGPESSAHTASPEAHTASPEARTASAEAPAQTPSPEAPAEPGEPAPMADPADLVTAIPHTAGTRLLGAAAFANCLVVYFRRDGLTGLRITRTDGSETEVSFPEPLYQVTPGANPDYDARRFRLRFVSLATPDSVYDADLETGQLTLLKRRPVLPLPGRGGYDPEDFEQHREWAIAPDGARVPISLICRKGAPRDGSSPLLLYGYGSYEISMDPGFSTSRLSLLDRGFVYAIAHVRGGGEMGRHWYDDGKALHKKNTFTDFVACAEHLVAQGWTSPERLIARGGSAGGLLMGAVANLAPQALGGIVAQVPFVDALTTILDPSLPLTVTEWEEWGDPLHDPQVYAYMKEYSPCENVSDRSYPPILAVTSLNDTRVLYREPAKWIARLRAAGRGGPFLLKTEMAAGHGGRSGRYDAWREEAMVLAWAVSTAAGA